MSFFDLIRVIEINIIYWLGYWMTELYAMLFIGVALILGVIFQVVAIKSSKVHKANKNVKKFKRFLSKEKAISLSNKKVFKKKCLRNFNKTMAKNWEDFIACDSEFNKQKLAYSINSLSAKSMRTSLYNISIYIIAVFFLSWAVLFRLAVERAILYGIAIFIVQGFFYFILSIINKREQKKIYNSINYYNIILQSNSIFNCRGDIKSNKEQCQANYFFESEPTTINKSVGNINDNKSINANKSLISNTSSNLCKNASDNISNSIKNNKKNDYINSNFNNGSQNDFMQRITTQVLEMINGNYSKRACSKVLECLENSISQKYLKKDNETKMLELIKMLQIRINEFDAIKTI